MNHKSSWAEENTSPRKENYIAENDSNSPRRIIIANKPSTGPEASGPANEEDILIVASKLKQYVKDKYDMNTSANVMEALSRVVRKTTDRAIERARSEGRKTLMDRDFE